AVRRGREPPRPHRRRRSRHDPGPGTRGRPGEGARRDRGREGRVPALPWRGRVGGRGRPGAREGRGEVLMPNGPVYAYGVARPGSSPGLRGIDGREVRTLDAGDLCAFVSDAPRGEVRATRERLLTHARVLDRLASDRTILPMRFGVVAPSAAALVDGALVPRARTLIEL